jgi:hypothetical protein
MNFLDCLIETLTYSSALIFVTQFAAYAWKRAAKQTSNAVPSRIDTEGRDVTELPGLWDEADQTVAQPEPAAPAQPEPKISDTVVPFIRPVRTYSDLALIRMAKKIGYPGAKKWSFNRKLSRTVRAELLRLAQQAS